VAHGPGRLLGAHGLGVLGCRRGGGLDLQLGFGAGGLVLGAVLELRGGCRLLARLGVLAGLLQRAGAYSLSLDGLDS